MMISTQILGVMIYYYITQHLKVISDLCELYL
jgi:hypothetical protein